MEKTEDMLWSPLGSSSVEAHEIKVVRMTISKDICCSTIVETSAHT